MLELGVFLVGGGRDLLAVALWEVVDEAPALRQADERAGAGVPELRVDRLLGALRLPLLLGLVDATAAMLGPGRVAVVFAST